MDIILMLLTLILLTPVFFYFFGIPRIIRVDIDYIAKNLGIHCSRCWKENFQAFVGKSFWSKMFYAFYHSRKAKVVCQSCGQVGHIDIDYERFIPQAPP